MKKATRGNFQKHDSFSQGLCYRKTPTYATTKLKSPAPRRIGRADSMTERLVLPDSYPNFNCRISSNARLGYEYLSRFYSLIVL